MGERNSKPLKQEKMFANHVPGKKLMSEVHKKLP